MVIQKKKVPSWCMWKPSQVACLWLSGGRNMINQGSVVSLFTQHIIIKHDWYGSIHIQFTLRHSLSRLRFQRWQWRTWLKLPRTRKTWRFCPWKLNLMKKRKRPQNSRWDDGVWGKLSLWPLQHSIYIDSTQSCINVKWKCRMKNHSVDAMNQI